LQNLQTHDTMFSDPSDVAFCQITLALVL